MLYEEFVQEIKARQAAPVYLFHGEEDYLRRQAVHLLVEALIPAGLQDLNIDRLDGRAVSASEIAACASTVPFGAPIRVVIVEDTPLFQGRRAKTGSEEEGDLPEPGEQKALLNYLADPCRETCLVLVASGKVDARSKLYRAAIKAGKELELTLPKGESLNEWIRSRVKARGKKIEQAAMEYMAATTGQNLNLLENEIEKAALYVEQQPSIDLAAIKKVGSRTTEAKIFDLVDAVGEKKTALALQFLREIFLAGEQPVPVALMLTRQVRLLLQAKLLGAQGHGGDQLASVMQVHPFVARKARSQSRNFQPAELEQALVWFAELDENLKNGRGDPRLLVEVAVLRLCQKKYGT